MTAIINGPTCMRSMEKPGHKCKNSQDRRSPLHPGHDVRKPFPSELRFMINLIRRSGWIVDTSGEEMENKLYVGNLPYTATEDDLKDHFSKAGNVTSVALIKDRATGRAKGFGFVEMSSADEAQKAISMFHGQDFMGRTITVNVARPREERPPRSGGGHRNF